MSVFKSIKEYINEIKNRINKITHYETNVVDKNKNRTEVSEDDKNEIDNKYIKNNNSHKEIPEKIILVSDIINSLNFKETLKKDKIHIIMPYNIDVEMFPEICNCGFILKDFVYFCNKCESLFIDKDSFEISCPRCGNKSLEFNGIFINSKLTKKEDSYIIEQQNKKSRDTR